MAKRKKASRKAAAGASASSGSGAGRGRKADPVETARRVGVLKRVDAGEMNNAAAAKELGLKLGTWAVWKSNYMKREGGGARRAAGAPKRGRPAKSTARAAKSAGRGGANVNSLQGLLDHLQGVQSFGRDLKEKVRSLAAFIESEFPG